jgi:hypothetical protein
MPGGNGQEVATRQVLINQAPIGRTPAVLVAGGFPVKAEPDQILGEIKWQ